jgi:hypothetical protein
LKFIGHPGISSLPAVQQNLQQQRPAPDISRHQEIVFDMLFPDRPM